ncbi:helix-turn-helix domain-containing protein [Streptomyces sp. NPDC020917]|uniref:helix-turn-helix domain-containing protein n=1 Tax=Streptomyces sp. NPDC020917 TaxID=3365102 RepID=UPI0037A03123
MSEMRRITDPEALKGLAHPLRRQLFRQVAQFGPTTGAVLAKRLGLDAGQIAYHLRELARHGFLEEAPELAKNRRERVWRAAPGAFSFSERDFEAPEMQAVAGAIGAQMAVQQFERLGVWQRGAESWDESWQQAMTSSESYLRLSAQELTDLCDELHTVLRRYRDEARQDARPDDGREHVFLFFHAFPERPES